MRTALLAWFTVVPRLTERENGENKGCEREFVLPAFPLNAQQHHGDSSLVKTEAWDAGVTGVTFQHTTHHLF